MAHEAENSKDPRHKRERKPTTEIPDIPDDTETYQKDIKDQFNEFKQMISKDKVKFEEEKQKNRQKLLQLMKEKDNLLKQETEDILTQIHNDEIARRQELLKQINAMKKKLLQKKTDIDAMLKKDLQLTERNEEILGATAKNTLEKLTKDVGKLLQGDLLNNGLTKTEPSVRTTRSLFDSIKFGNYHPLTMDLRTWKPADILSLKRDQFLGSNRLIPPNDYPIFKNLFDQNRLFSYRKRRSIESLRNDINDYLNEIDSDKFSTFAHSKGYGPGKGNFGNRPSEIKKGNVIQKIGNQIKANENVISSNIQSLLQTTNKINNKTNDAMPKDETKMLQNLVTNVTSFLKTLADNLGKYMRGFAGN